MNNVKLRVATTNFLAYLIACNFALPATYLFYRGRFIYLKSNCCVNNLNFLKDEKKKRNEEDKTCNGKEKKSECGNWKYKKENKN